MSVTKKSTFIPKVFWLVISLGIAAITPLENDLLRSELMIERIIDDYPFVIALAIILVVLAHDDSPRNSVASVTSETLTSNGPNVPLIV